MWISSAEPLPKIKEIVEVFLHCGERLAGIGVRDGTLDLTHAYDSVFRQKNDDLRAIF